MRGMRTLLTALVCALLSGPWLVGAGAQTLLAPRPFDLSPALDGNRTGEVDFGGRVTTVDGDRGRFERLRDLRSGPTLDRFRYRREKRRWVFGADIDHAGYRDQRFAATAEQYGGLRASFEWNQVPLFYGDTLQTPYRAERLGVLRLDDATQAAVQNRTTTVQAGYAGALTTVDARSRRDVADMRVAYGLTKDVDLRMSLTRTARNGVQPWGASFGFSNPVQVAAPVRNRTHDLGTSVEWSNPRGLLRAAYDGSWFDNEAESLVWDNPLRATDQTYASAYSGGDGPSQGRMTLWPASRAHTVSGTGSVALPWRSRAFANVSVGSWLQDSQLLPFTINSAIAPIPLDRASAQAEARITAMNYRFTSRPTPALWFSGQYRLYDYDNRTPHFAVRDYVRLDGNVATSVTGGSEPFDYTRHFVDLDASFTPWRHAALRGGYGQERDDRSYRLFEETTDRTVRASLDTAGFNWGMARLQYDRSERTGTGLDEQVFSDIGEQVSLRQFDIADRTRDRVSAVVQLLPTAVLGVGGTLAIGRERRPGSAFGLQDNDLHAATVEVDYTPAATVSAGLTYGFERYGTRQQSRQASPGPQFLDPTRDWWTNLDEDVHTVSANLDLPRLTARLGARVGYDYVGSRAAYTYEVRPDTTLATPEQLAPVRNVIHRATAEARQGLTRDVTLGFGYWFDHYDVQDFALSPGTLNNPLMPGFMNLLGQWRPYKAHTGYVRLMYAW